MYYIHTLTEKDLKNGCLEENMPECMYICMCVYMSVHTYMHTYIYPNVRSPLKGRYIRQHCCVTAISESQKFIIREDIYFRLKKSPAGTWLDLVWVV